MSWAEEIAKGQEVFRKLVLSLSPRALVDFGQPSQGRYPVTILQAGKSARVWISEEEFADLAHNGGRRADIEMRLRDALASR